ncbi:unnamed protein product [Meloidogyne enterolobii]|uniref:Uncharacterized protein n=1 Tax=Meloidogyne enterolobii TaxID=390850 RepID=A0ACB1ABN1_MELEN
MLWKNSLDGTWIDPAREGPNRTQPTVPPSNPWMGYLFSFIFLLQVRTQQ